MNTYGAVPTIIKAITNKAEKGDRAAEELFKRLKNVARLSPYHRE